MIEERAVILAVETSAQQNTPIATIAIERKTACGLCGKTRGCGNAMWGKLFMHQSSAFKAKNHINAKVGQSVIVGIQEQDLVKSALLLYLLPLVTMAIASILATQILDTNENAILGAIIGLVVGFFWVKGFTANSRYFFLKQPEILRIETDNVLGEIKSV